MSVHAVHAGVTSAAWPLTSDLHMLSLTAMLDGGDLVVLVDGEVDVSTAPHLRSFLLQVDDGERVLVVDLSDMDFLDAAGLSVLVALQRRLAQRASQVVLRSPSASTRRLLQITGLEELFWLS
jgi:anti-sigma B factor antagonist